MFVTPNCLRSEAFNYTLFLSIHGPLFISFQFDDAVWKCLLFYRSIPFACEVQRFDGMISTTIAVVMMMMILLFNRTIISGLDCFPLQYFLGKKERKQHEVPKEMSNYGNSAR